ncbi:MAG: right-handed parallel beta-helix repeat-containing protein [Syntrophales bacterium]
MGGSISARPMRTDRSRKKLSWAIWVFAALLFAATEGWSAGYYDMGSPVLTDLWVDPVLGNDGRTGASRPQALRTLTEALNRVPIDTPFTTGGYRILLVPGDYPEGNLPGGGWIESRQGSYQYPLIIQAADGPRSVRLHGYLNVNRVSYFYLINLDVVTDPGYGGGGNVIHIADSHHILIRGCTLSGYDGAVRQPQETLKVNQVQYAYVEHSDLSGAFWFPLDFVAVHYGHVLSSRIHDSGDDCLLLKGGTASLTVEGNEIYDCGVTGFSAGQGTGFEFMVPPWVHYEVTDIKFINNILHDVVNAGLAVRGGYNILLAYNTLYRIGTDPRGAGLLLLSQGERSCDGDSASCLQRHTLGGWGPVTAGESGQWIPNRNVLVLNNIFFNPHPLQTREGHFTIFGPATAPSGTNIPSPADADGNVQIRGNLIWNGPVDHPLGIEDTAQGCQPANATCNASQLRADNSINLTQPQFRNPVQGDVHPAPGSNIFGTPVFAIPRFAGGDHPQPPLPPEGNLDNSVSDDYARSGRTSLSPPGALATNASLTFPHVDTSLPWQTEIAVINTGDQTITGTLRGLSDEGRFVEAKAITLSARGRREITVADEFTGHTDIGYLIFDTTSEEAQGYSKFSQAGLYRAAIPAVKEVNTADIFISHIDSSAQWWTGVSLVNTTAATKELTITFNNGQSVPYTLYANQHRVFTIGSLLNRHLQPDIQSAVITNAQGIVGLELFGSYGSGNLLDGILLTDDTASTLYYPHVDSNGWWTGIVAYNPSDSGCTMTITPYSAGGIPFPAVTRPLEGKEKYVGVVSELDLPTGTAWIRIDSTRPLTGFELFGTVTGNQLAAYTGSAGTAARTGVFAKIERNGGTGIAFVNTESAAASVTLTAYTDFGSVAATRVLSVGGYAKVVNRVEELFPQGIANATYIAYSSDRNVMGFQLNASADGMMLDGLPGLTGID